MSALRKYITLIALGLCGGVMYVYPYIRYVFHTPLNEALNCNEAQAGFLITCYGIVSLMLYIPGGILADKLRAKKPLVLSMCWAFVLLVGFAVVLGIDLGPFNYTAAIAVWVLMPFATTFVFWSSLVKAIGMAGDSDEQGRCFGIYFAANAVFGTLISTTNMWTYTTFNSTEGMPSGFCGVTISVAFYVGVAILAVLIFFKETKVSTHESCGQCQEIANNQDNSFKLADVKIVLKNKNIWIASITMMLIYMMFTCVTYFTPYMVDVCGLSSELSGALSIFRTYVIMIFAAIFSGIIADKIFHSTLRWFKFASISLAISTVVFIAFGFSAVRDIFHIPNNIYVIAIISILPGIFSTMIYSIQFSVLSEISIPSKLLGTASGIASMFVFSPDIFLNTALGVIIDWGKTTNQIEIGYLIIFIILIVICVSIFVLCSVLLRINKK